MSANRSSPFCIVLIVFLALAIAHLSSNSARAQNWPQWLGPNRDAKITGFKAPAAWPKELQQKWKVEIGDGVATPALIDDKLFVFSRQDNNELVRCLDAATGKEVWQDKYESPPIMGSASGFQGPRSSPTVADGKLITLGTRGILSCYDLAGKLLWRKNDFPGTNPRFYFSSSPLVTDGVCMVQLGGNNAALVAYKLNTGEEAWRWTGDGSAYSSPVMLSVDGTAVVVAVTDKNIVAIDPGSQKILWQVPYAPVGSGYNAATPIVNSNMLIYSGSGRGTKAVKFEKTGNELAATEVWSNPNVAVSVQFNTPVLKDGFIYGISAAETFFCINAADGKTAWTTPRMEGKTGYGSIVDAGSVLFALTPACELMVIEPSGKEFKQLASYKVGEFDTYAYPIISGNRVFVKDKNDVMLWTIE